MEQDKAHTGRLSNRFLCLTIAFSTAIVIFFVIVGIQIRQSHKDIVNLYCAEVVSPSDNVQLDKTITSLLQLELDKIQEGMIILSIWAGVLMIVFLVFSLYSMHRSDELEKESHDNLKMMKQASAAIKKEADDSIKEVSKKSSAELSNIHEMIDQHKREYEEMAAVKQAEFNALYVKYTDALKKSTSDYKIGIKNIVEAIRQFSADVDESNADQTE